MKNLISIRVGTALSSLLLTPAILFAQSGVEGALTTIKDWVIGIVNVVFIILIVFGIIRTVAAFIGGSPNAVRYLIHLFVAVLIWSAFSLIVVDVNIFGGLYNL